jgi:alkylation response protein AidB-like acyl-CoA dehydrogenase
MSSEAEALIQRVRDLAPEIAKRAAEIENARELPADLLSELTRAGCFRMFVPKSHGGLEVDLVTGLEVLECLARADGATGWTVMIGSETPILLALLSRKRFDEIYSDGPDLIAGGAFAPRGKAERKDHGYQVTGRWAFASGCRHCNWLIGDCVVTENGKPRPGPLPGVPELRTALFPAARVEIIDTWMVNGLRGTGSNDIAVKDLFVPAEDTSDLFFGPSCLPGPLFTEPLIHFVVHMGAVAVGIAQHAIDDIIALAGTNKRRLFASASLIESAVFQNRLGLAETSLRAARSFLRADCEAFWRSSVQSGWLPTGAERERLSATTTWVAQTAAAVVDTCYTAGGGTSPYDSSPLQRHLRDIHTLTQHAALADERFTRAGATLLGREVPFAP